MRWLTPKQEQGDAFLDRSAAKGSSGGLSVGKTTRPLPKKSKSYLVDKKHKKKLKRAAKKKKEKATAQEAQNKLKNRVNMFDRLPKECSTCEKDFPLTQEAHMAWQVQVLNEEKKVWLFCPDCQENTKQMAENNNEI